MEKRADPEPPKLVWGFIALVLLACVLCALLLYLFGEHIGIFSSEKKAWSIASIAMLGVFIIGIHAMVEGGRVFGYIKQLLPFGRTRDAQRASDANAARRCNNVS